MRLASLSAVTAVVEAIFPFVFECLLLLLLLLSLLSLLSLLLLLFAPTTSVRALELNARAFARTVLCEASSCRGGHCTDRKTIQ